MAMATKLPASPGWPFSHRKIPFFPDYFAVWAFNADDLVDLMNPRPRKRKSALFRW